MKVKLGLITLLIVAVSMSAASKRSIAKGQVAFGVRLAMKGLWRSATDRFESAMAIDPTYSSAWNDVAIAYEQLARPEDANKAYLRALELDPKDQYIKDNYITFREIYDRQKAARGK